MTVFWKILHFLYRFKITKIFARIFEFLNYLICSNAVSARAEIGTGTKFWHRGVGCTVHYKAKIGNYCKILPNVMIGAKFKDGEPDERVPIVGDNVFIGTGAVVVGNIKVGNNVIIAANSVVTRDIPDNCYALEIPANVKQKEHVNNENNN